jgi:hypothetical protein
VTFGLITNPFSLATFYFQVPISGRFGFNIFERPGGGAVRPPEAGDLSACRGSESVRPPVSAGLTACRGSESVRPPVSAGLTACCVGSPNSCDLGVATDSCPPQIQRVLL